MAEEDIVAATEPVVNNVTLEDAVCVLDTALDCDACALTVGEPETDDEITAGEVVTATADAVGAADRDDAVVEVAEQVGVAVDGVRTRMR